MTSTMPSKIRALGAAGCLAAVVCLGLLWMRSYSVHDGATFARRSGQHGPVGKEILAGPDSNHGTISFGGLSRWADDPRGMPDAPDGWETGRYSFPVVGPTAPARHYPGVDIEFLGFSLTWSRERKTWPIRGPNQDTDLDNIKAGVLPREYTTRHELIFWIGAPDWFMSASLALPPLFWLRRFRRERLVRQRCRLGLCRSCGYNLRGIAERCPECGADVSEKLKPATRLLSDT